MSLNQTVIGQFKQPRGVLGHVVGWILAGRGSNLARNRWTVDLLNLGANDRVLEIGCGPGVALELVLARGKGVSAVGIDHSKVMIAQARKRNRGAVKKGRLKLIEGTLEALPADSAPFDKAFSINLIQFVDDKAAFAARVKSLLKPGGVFATTFQPRSAKATRADALDMAARVSKLLTAAGFTSVRTEELDLKPVPAVCVAGVRGA